MESAKENDIVIINLSQDEAIVLSEWLNKINQNEHPDIFEDKAEELVLFKIEAELEKILIAPFKSNYEEILTKARKNVRDNY